MFAATITPGSAAVNRRPAAGVRLYRAVYAMMQALRSRAGNIIAKVLFGLLAVSFAFWGIYTRSPFSDSKAPDTVVATVGDQSIRVDELQQAMQPALQRLQSQFGTTIGPEQIKQLGIADT